MIHRVWRQFRPKNVLRVVQPKTAKTELWQQARGRVHALFPGRQIRDDVMAQEIQRLRSDAEKTNDPITWCTVLILQAPRAVRAQQQMDAHPHGYRNKQARLYELIDFNDTFVSAVLSMPENELAHFNDELRRAIDSFCRQVRMRSFSLNQFEAIVHGLSREIAVYRGALAEGLEAEMTSRTQDAFGIDMILTDSQSQQSINVDCKAASAFYYRIKDLEQENRITPNDAAAAEEQGYCYVTHRNDFEAVEIVLLRIDEQTYGSIRNFSFADTSILGKKLRQIITESSRRNVATIEP